MTKVTKGERYTATVFRSGQSERGAWEMIKVADNNGKNELTIFPSNIPSGVGEQGDFLLKDILEVRVGFRKSKKDDKWYQETNITAEVEAIKSDIVFEDIGEDGELPWEDGDFMADIGLPL